MVVFAEKPNHDHDHHKNHIGIGLGATSFIAENEFATGLHLHYMHRLNEHSPFSLGLGYEAIVGKHQHHTITGLLSYSFLESFSIKAGPGIAFTNEEGQNESRLSGHAELMYEFELGDIHLGPMIGYGYDGEESHASLGVHVGFSF